MTPALRFAPLALGLSSLACATFNEPVVPSKPVAQFPSAAALAAVEGRAVEIPPSATGEVPEEGWTIDPALAVVSPAEPWNPQGAWDEAFARAYAATGRSARLTRALACVAAELGRFTLEHQAAPPESLQRFVAAGCGATAPSVPYQFLSAAASSKTKDEDLLRHYQGQLESDLVAHLPAKASELGFWFGRRGDRILALAAYSEAPVELQPFSLVPDAGGRLTLEGRLLGDADSFGGLVNQGWFGVSPCLVDPAVARPRFRVTCQLARDDATAWIQIVYAAPHSVLALPIVQILARRDPTKPLVFLEPPPAASHPVVAAADFRAAMVTGLNTVRAQAGLGPVRLSPAESETATRVARSYFAAMMGAGRVDDMNTVTLGLLAGWQVTGTISGGTFYAALLPNTRDVGRWLDHTLALPMGREALLGRDIEEIACGPTFTADPKGMGAIVAAYRFQHGNDHTADVAQLHARVNAARERLRMPPAQLMRGARAIIDDELAGLQRGEQGAYQALQAALQSASRNYGMGVPLRGIVVEAVSLDALDLPPEIVARPSRTFH